MRGGGVVKFAGLLCLVAVGLAIMGGCAMFKTKEGLAAPAESVDGRLVEALSSFGFNLFHRLRQEEPGENIFISPASVAMALAMTYNGAAGETRQAMAEVLQLQGMSLEEINAAFADLKTILQNPDPKVELAVANSLWAREGVGFNDDFLQRNRDYFRAAVEELNFDDPGAADTINRWVREQTRNRIEDIVEPPIHPLTVLFLINAIFFKGEWSEQFDPRLTREIPFHLPDGSRKNHPVMFREGEFSYLERDGFQAVRLPYGKTGRVSMYVFLPSPDSSLEEFYRGLNAASWAAWMDSFREMEGEVGLPRFSFAYESSLNDALSALGMEIAFNQAAADFSGMRPIPPRLFISNVKHKTFIEVNEKGTEAAAATSVEIRLESLPQRFEMIVDRPFFFAIADNKTGIILFMGGVRHLNI